MFGPRIDIILTYLTVYELLAHFIVMTSRVGFSGGFGGFDPHCNSPTPYCLTVKNFGVMF
jgi:hypothetical protein